MVEEAELTTDEPLASGQHAVLIVDDEVTFRRSLAEGLSLLSGEKYRPVCVGSVDQALALLKNRQFSALVTDIRMPGRDGLQLLLEMKRQSIRIPTLVTTAYGSPAVHAQAARSGAVRYIEKPFPLEQLLEFLESATVDRTAARGRTLDLIEVIEMLCMGKRDMRVGVRTRDVQGIVFVREGEIVHAEAGDRKGVEALIELLALPHSQISTDPGEVTEEVTISQPWQELTEEAWRRRTLAPPPQPRREPLPSLEFNLPEDSAEIAEPSPDTTVYAETPQVEHPTEQPRPVSPPGSPPLPGFWEEQSPSDVEARVSSLRGSAGKPSVVSLDDPEQTSILVVIDGAQRVGKILRGGLLVGCVVKTGTGVLIHVPLDDLRVVSSTCYDPCLPERGLYGLARDVRPDETLPPDGLWGAVRSAGQARVSSGGVDGGS